MRYAVVCIGVCFVYAAGVLAAKDQPLPATGLATAGVFLCQGAHSTKK
jgi:hypothetical protein